MNKRKNQLEERLKKERQLEAELKKYSPGPGIDKRKDVDLYRIDLEEGLVYVRINPRASREAIHLQLDKELNERWPPLHKKKMELTHEQRNSLEEGMMDSFRKVAATGLVAPQKLKTIESDFWDAWRGRRLRAERLRNLEAYRLRSLKYTYPKISSEIGITSVAARKAFGSAYKLIHGTPYNRKDLKPETSRALLSKDCGTCTDKLSCKKLCPEIEAYGNIDSVSDKRYYRLSGQVADPRGSALPAKGRGSREMGKEAYADDDEQ